ncbi:MAG: PD-(D/E)XK nuclease family protein, partial [Gemmatimonadota bacterium]
GDKISRYVVARTPVGALAGMAPDAWPSGREAERIAHAVRTRLLEEGYGTVVSAWTRALSDAAPARDRSRLRQLAELAFEWDRRATLRPSDFVRHVEAARAEDPATAAIRVMTIHKAKGLEFDAVVLPELDGVALAGDVREPFLPFRAGGAGPVQRVFPTVPKALRPLFPEMAGAIAQAREREVRDGLSTLYVALTRARHALYIVVKPASARTTARTAARLLAATLWPGRGTGPAEILWEDGVADWWSDTRLEGQLLRPFVSAHARAREARPAAIGLAAGARRRLLPRRAPSELEGGEIVRLEDLLRPASRLSREEGTAVHAWLEAIGWREDGLPERTALLALAAERSPRLGDASALLDHFLKWIARPEVAALLRRASYPSGTTVEREVSFIARDGPRLLQGVVDRLVRIPEAGGPRLVAVDWKTDALDPADASALEARAAYYRPQIEAYLRALAAGERLPKEKVRGLLVFLRPGVVREISLS